MNPVDAYNDPGLVQAKNEADTAFQQYGTATANAISMPDMLKSALDKKFASQDNPLFAQQAGAVSNYANILDTGYRDVLPENNQGMIFSPESQQAQIQGKRNSALGELSGINSRIAGGFGGIENVIKEATNTYRAQATASQFKSEGARAKYMDLLDQIDRKVAQLNTDRDFAENTRQFNLEMALKQQEAAKGSAADQDNAVYQQMVKEIKGRATLNQMLNKFGGQIDPNRIYQAYNSASPRGQAKESAEQLAKLGITGTSADTAAVRTIKTNASSSLKLLDDFEKIADFSKTGFLVGNQTKTFQNTMPALSDPTLVTMNSRIGPIREMVINVISGAQVSAEEAKRVTGWIPDISKSPQKNKEDLITLRNWLKAKSGAEIGSTSNKTQDWNKLLKEAGL